MKKLIYALILGGLFSIGLTSGKPDHPVPLIPAGGANQPASSASIEDVLRAHNAAQNADSLSAFSAEGVRLTSRPAGVDRELPSFFERQVSVAQAGNSFKLYTADPLKLREQFDLSDGGALYHAVAEGGRLIQEAGPMAGPQPGGGESSVKTFGLVPILKQLLDPATEAAYSGRTVGGQDKFNISTATDRWTLYADVEHLIRRVEMGDRTLEYASYRLVQGVRLPFIQRLSVGGQPFQELVFTRINLNPELPSGYFSRESFPK
ncbi:MAG TPA: hypothetical protein VF762_05450 [Blastocatellia bacterium]|jgi:hypothetical protein